MRTERWELDGREITRIFRGAGGALLVQPVDDHDLECLDAEAFILAERTGDAPFALAAFRVKDWNGELSPWPAPPAFGDEAFAGHGRETLAWVEARLLPALGAAEYDFSAIGGYSLAGLFALYAAWESDAFAAAAGVSPSVWLPGWREYAAARPPKARRVYLSLGDREERTRNPAMRPVGDNLRALYDQLSADPALQTILEWNPGNHFREPELRTARGWEWVIG